MNQLKKIILLSTLMLSTQAYATMYENAEDESSSRWQVYDNTPAGATIDNVYSNQRDNNAIEFIGAGTSNGYMLGNLEKRKGAWNNTKEHTLKWKMNFTKGVVVYIRVMTKEGARYLYYTNSSKSYGKRNSTYIHIGLGKKASDGAWHAFTRDLEADLKKYEPNNQLIAVNAFLVRGNGFVDDVELIDSSSHKRLLNFTKIQRHVTNQIISIFENSTTTIQYGYAEVVRDDKEHGITAGRLGFTSATGDMRDFIENYYHQKPLSKYLPELKRLEEIYAENDYELSDDPNGSMNVEYLSGLIQDWKYEAKKDAFKNAQDRYLDDHYFIPALKEARKIQLKLPISLLCFYDTAIQQGVDGLKDVIQRVSLSKPTNEKEEIEWIKAFNQKRLDELERKSYWEDSVYRVHTLNELVASKKYDLDISTVVIREWGNETFRLKSLNKSWYTPNTKVTWQIQLNETINTEYNVDIYDVDLYDTPKKTIEQLHKEGKKVICYFSAGSYEDWRDDASLFPKKALGNKMDGWDEQWLDIRNSKVKIIMQKRMDIAKEKRCDGVDPDNVDGYMNKTSFHLSSHDQLEYNIFLAKEAHKRGLSIGLKNDLEQIPSLVGYFDFAVNEECNSYNECDKLQPFTKQNKAVLNIEYEEKYLNDNRKLCKKMSALHMYTLVLPIGLDDDFRIDCE